MKIYQIRYQEGYKIYGLKDASLDFIFEMDTINSLKTKWGKKKLEMSDNLKDGDIHYFASVPGEMLVTKETVDKMKDIFDLSYMELLPVYYEEKEFYFVHLIKAYHITALGLDNGNKAGFKEKELIENGIENCYLFKGKYKTSGGTSSLYVTEKFINVFQSANLKGITFKEVWNSDDGKIVDQIEEQLYKICFSLTNEKKIINQIDMGYFWDGECLDLGSRIIIYDKVTDEIEIKNISFIDDEYEIENLKEYFKTKSKEEYTTLLKCICDEIRLRIMLDESFQKKVNAFDKVVLKSCCWD